MVVHPGRGCHCGEYRIEFFEARDEISWRLGRRNLHIVRRSEHLLRLAFLSEQNQILHRGTEETGDMAYHSGCQR